MTYMDMRQRKGITLLELITILAVILALILAFTSFFGIGKAMEMGKIAVAKVEITSVDLDPNLDIDGATKTYTVTVELADNVDASVQLQVQVFENDFSNDLLDSNVPVIIVRGTKSGTGTFTLRCINEPDFFGDDAILVGEDGRDDDEAGSSFAIFGEVVAKDNILGGVAADEFQLLCRRMPLSNG